MARTLTVNGLRSGRVGSPLHGGETHSRPAARAVARGGQRSSTVRPVLPIGFDSTLEVDNEGGVAVGQVPQQPVGRNDGVGQDRLTQPPPGRHVVGIGDRLSGDRRCGAPAGIREPQPGHQPGLTSSGLVSGSPGQERGFKVAVGAFDDALGLRFERSEVNVPGGQGAAEPGHPFGVAGTTPDACLVDPD